MQARQVKPVQSSSYGHTQQQVAALHPLFSTSSSLNETASMRRTGIRHGEPTSTVFQDVLAFQQPDVLVAQHASGVPTQQP